MKHYCLFTIPQNGKRVVWEITTSCNMNCNHCCSNANKTHNNDFLFLSRKETVIFKKIDEMISLGVKEFYISGGEPFLMKDIFPFLIYLKEKKIKVSIATNGYFISEEFTKKISKIGIDLLHISIDGHCEKIHNSLRGGNFFKQVIKNIIILLDYNVPIRIGCIVWKKNEYFLEEMVQFCIKLGVKELRLNKLIKVGRFLKNNQLSPVRSWSAIIEDIKTLKIKYSDKIKITIHELNNKKCMEICPGGNSIFFINPKGQVSPCSWIAKNFSQFTTKETIYNKKLYKLLKDDSMKNFRDNLKKNRNKGFYCPFIDNLFKNENTLI